MVAAQVMGLDAAIAVAGQSGNFQLNVMLPLIANNLLTASSCWRNARARARRTLHRGRRARRRRASTRRWRAIPSSSRR